jgi:hypothetical protein
MKHFIPIFLALFLCCNTQSAPTKTVVLEKVKDLNFPQAIISCKHHDWGVTTEIPLKDSTLVGDVYQTHLGVKNTRIICTRLASTTIATDSPLDEEAESYRLTEADIYLVQIKIPNRNWITKTVIYQGTDQTVNVENEIIITIKKGS